KPVDSATSPTSHGIARSFIATLLGACNVEMSMLDPAKEPDSRGAEFAFDLLGVRDDDRPDAPEFGDRVGVVVDAEIVIHAWLADGRHQQRGRLLAALVAAGRLSGFERHEQALGEITPLAVTRAKGPGHRRDDVGTGQHVAGDRELVGLLVTAPRHAARPGVAERALTVEPVYLTKLAVTVFSKQGAQRDNDRHPLGHER